MIEVIFKQGQDTTHKSGIWQWDYGQILRIQGLKLPTAVEVHFSLTDIGGEAVTRIGVTKDGVTDVPIPDSMLENEDCMNKDYKVYAFIYLTDETSGETVKKITLVVNTRPKPSDGVPPEEQSDLFGKVMEAVNAAAKKVEESANRIDGNIQLAIDSASGAQVAEGNAVAAKEQAELSKNQASTSATLAALSEQAAKESKNQAAEYSASAETAANSANEAAEQTALDREQTGKDALQTAADRKATSEDRQAVADYREAIESSNAEKVDKQQGVENAGKFLMTDDDGNVSCKFSDGLRLIRHISLGEAVVYSAYINKDMYGNQLKLKRFKLVIQAIVNKGNQRKDFALEARAIRINDSYYIYTGANGGGQDGIGSLSLSYINFAFKSGENLVYPELYCTYVIDGYCGKHVMHGTARGIASYYYNGKQNPSWVTGYGLKDSFVTNWQRHGLAIKENEYLNSIGLYAMWGTLKNVEIYLYGEDADE